jgi:hypothetical protein
MQVYPGPVQACRSAYLLGSRLKNGQASFRAGEPPALGRLFPRLSSPFPSWPRSEPSKLSLLEERFCPALLGGVLPAEVVDRLVTADEDELPTP